MPAGLPPALRGRRRWLLLLVVAAACVPYLPTIDDYFLQDDFGVVQLLVTRPWTMFPQWFTTPWMEDIWGSRPDEIRPFVAFTYQLTGKWAPHRPELHHIVNIAMHAANALLVLGIGRAALGLSPVAASFAAIVFAVLPSQTESVAWITGRVDSMPAFFYLATLLAYVQWRRHGHRSAYGLAVLFFFVALFTKQNAITMVATLAAYDLLVVGRERRGSLRSMVAAWVPFGALTAGYLLLRQAVFGHTVRGGVASRHQVDTFLEMADRHLRRVTLGHTSPLSDWEIAAAVVIVAAAVFAAWRNVRFVRLFLCFGVIWWVVGIAPTVVAGYESPRHAYLASAAWAFALALVFDRVTSVLNRVERWPVLNGVEQWPVLNRVAQWLPLAAASALVLVYLVRLVPAVRHWGTIAEISNSAVRRVHQEALSAPDGTLLLVGVPRSSWEWGVPFVIQPPYQPEDLTTRIRLVTPWRLYCCGAEQWDVYARRQLQAWLDAPHRPPLIALHVAPETGDLSRLTEAEDPELRALIPVLLQTDTPETLDGAIVNLLERVVKK